MSASVASVETFEAVAVQPIVVTQAPARRLALLDTARVVAAMGIVWVHASTSAAGQLLYPLGTFGVPFYTFIALLFMARSLTRENARSLGQYVMSRFFRIYTPFLFWSAAYVSMGIAKATAKHEALPHLSWSVLYAGGFEHLWFLPFLMIVTIAGAVIVSAVKHSSAARVGVAAALIALGTAACFLKEPAWIARRTDDLYFWRFAFRALPTVFWSIALALLTVLKGKLPRTTPAMATGGALLLASALLFGSIITPVPVLRSLSGLGCLIVALMPFSSSLLAPIGKLGRHSYGIYLSHVVFLRVIVLITERYHTPASLTLDIVSFVIAFAGASVLSVLLSQSAWTRWTVGE